MRLQAVSMKCRLISKIRLFPVSPSRQPTLILPSRLLLKLVRAIVAEWPSVLMGQTMRITSTKFVRMGHMTWLFFLGEEQKGAMSFLAHRVLKSRLLQIKRMSSLLSPTLAPFSCTSTGPRLIPRKIQRFPAEILVSWPITTPVLKQ